MVVVIVVLGVVVEVAVVFVEVVEVRVIDVAVVCSTELIAPKYVPKIEPTKTRVKDAPTIYKIFFETNIPVLTLAKLFSSISSFSILIKNIRKKMNIFK